MAKSKTSYHCRSCGGISSKWSGQCAECGEWNTLEETLTPAATGKTAERFQGYAGSATITSIDEVDLTEETRFGTGMSELDRALGGGVVAGSVTLIGGDPGIGKSTLLLQCMASLSNNYSTLYVTGEESLQQVTLRARRLGLPAQKLRLLTETCVESITHHALTDRPQVMVID
ncbi:MAG: ATPase domain-containing protein, partial [Pseudomonadota bacterium]